MDQLVQDSESAEGRQAPGSLARKGKKPPPGRSCNFVYDDEVWAAIARTKFPVTTSRDS